MPRRYAGFSPCFRREAGAAGSDTRGIFRVHQFDKVEMFSFVEPADAPAEHERLLAIEEEILQGLGIPYRVVNIAVDDLGSSRGQEVRPRGLAAVPAALPRADLDLEHDRLPVAPARHPLPARTAASPRTCTRLNGTAVAVGRTLIALMENHQTEDGGGRRARTCCGSGERLSGWVDLEGAVNVRDLGGLPVDGRRVDRVRACCCARTTCRG